MKNINPQTIDTLKNQTALSAIELKKIPANEKITKVPIIKNRFVKSFDIGHLKIK